MSSGLNRILLVTLKENNRIWLEVQNQNQVVKRFQSGCLFHARQQFGVKDWQKASEWQLKLREKMHEYISLFCDMFHNKNSEAVRIGILKAKEFNHLKQ